MFFEEKNKKNSHILINIFHIIVRYSFNKCSAQRHHFLFGNVLQS